MRAAVVQEADRDLCRETVGEVLRAEGAEVTESTHSHVRFRRWRPRGEYGFARAGYVGLHGHAGEKDLDLRVAARAGLPRRTLVAASVVAVGVTLLFFAVQPTPGWWVAVAALLWPAWIAAAVLAWSARRVDREAETDLHARLVETLRARGQTVLTEAEIRRRAFEADVEGEIAEKRLKAARGAKR